MIIRIVRMTFAPEYADNFLVIFAQSKTRILEMEGCIYLELWQDCSDSNVFTTHSHWTSEEALDAYRQTDFFREVWARTRILFAEKPMAFSSKRIL